jgi:predicted  nucleic acid-binding Zn-ribbon protein
VRCEIHRAQLTAQGLEQQNRELHQAIAKRNRKIADLEARLLSISKEKTQHDDPDGPP